MLRNVWVGRKEIKFWFLIQAGGSTVRHGMLVAVADVVLDEEPYGTEMSDVFVSVAPVQ